MSLYTPSNQKNSKFFCCHHCHMYIHLQNVYMHTLALVCWCVHMNNSCVIPNLLHPRLFSWSFCFCKLASARQPRYLHHICGISSPYATVFIICIVSEKSTNKIRLYDHCRGCGVCCCFGLYHEVFLIFMLLRTFKLGGQDRNTYSRIVKRNSLYKNWTFKVRPFLITELL